MTDAASSTRPRVPFIDLRAQYDEMRGEIDAAIQRVLDSGIDCSCSKMPARPMERSTGAERLDRSGGRQRSAFIRGKTLARSAREERSSRTTAPWLRKRARSGTTVKNESTRTP